MQGIPTIGKPLEKCFQAKFEHARKTKSANGQTVLEQHTGTICRDSQGRERIDDYTQDGHVVRVFDPIRKTEFMLDAEAKTVLFQVSLSSDGFRAYTWSVNKSAIALTTSPPQSEPDLDWKEIEGVQCAGYQIQKQDDYTVQYWISCDLNQIFLVNIVSREEETTWRLFDLRYVEPELSVFNIPGNFTNLQ